MKKIIQLVVLLSFITALLPPCAKAQPDSPPTFCGTVQTTPPSSPQF